MRSVIILGLALLLSSAARADEPQSFELAAEKVQACVVTVRVTNPASAAGTARVTVCSGVSVGDGRIVTPIYAGTDSKIRITLADGEQASASVEVIDEHSGLALLQSSKLDLPGLELAPETPSVGSWVIGAAAWGTQKPVVSLGIVSGLERTLSDASLPPLIQCDLRTTETSSGGAVVDRQGRLVGIIVLADSSETRRGWTYAVPASHVQRLMRTHEGRQAEGVVILKRRRPEVGMVLDGDNQRVTVGRVTPGSPADKAGIRVGDEVLAVDQTQIRSVYQAVRPVMLKQPGDSVVFAVRRDGAESDIEVVLGGGVELPAAPFENLGQYVQPKIDVEGLGTGMYQTRRGIEVREVFAPPPEELDDRTISDAERIELLEKALDRYRSVIVYLQGQIGRHEEERQNTEDVIRSLKSEIKTLEQRTKGTSKE